MEKGWLGILEQYYLKTNAASYKSFIDNLGRINEMQNDLVAIEGAYILYILNIPKGIEVLKQFGISGKNIKQKISQKRTKFNLAIAKAEAKQKKTAKADYYNMLARASKSVGYRIPNDILLVEWIGILNGIKQDNELANKQAGSSNTRGTSSISRASKRY